jgi:ribosomal protein L19E
LDPNEINEIKLANSRRNVIRLKKDGLIIKKAAVVHSRSRVTARLEAKRKGRHTGKFNQSKEIHEYIIQEGELCALEIEWHDLD